MAFDEIMERRMDGRETGYTHPPDWISPLVLLPYVLFLLVLGPIVGLACSFSFSIPTRLRESPTVFGASD